MNRNHEGRLDQVVDEKYIRKEGRSIGVVDGYWCNTAAAEHVAEQASCFQSPSEGRSGDDRGVTGLILTWFPVYWCLPPYGAPDRGRTLPHGAFGGGYSICLL
ncbi:hypothetical protein KM043_016522 [Ampulex compressa]|nr:hypothetical protein KM043_016522 [Ampulex compressa]